jgi:hypothetical protein
MLLFWWKEKKMTDLTKRESAYFMFAAVSGLAIMLGILAFWASTQPNCWEQYSTEVQAIEACEQ